MRALVLGLLLLSGSAWAGPWTHGPGHGYSKDWVSVLPGVGWNGELGTTPAMYGYYQETFVGTYAELGPPGFYDPRSIPDFAAGGPADA